MKTALSSKYFLLVITVVSALSFSLTSCEAETQDAYIDFQIFEGSWYYQDETDLVVVSFFRSILYKDILLDGEITDHEEYGMVESVSKNTMRINGKTSEYKFIGGKLYLKEVVLPGQSSNKEWFELLPGEPLYQ